MLVSRFVSGLRRARALPVRRTLRAPAARGAAASRRPCARARARRRRRRAPRRGPDPPSPTSRCVPTSAGRRRAWAAFVSAKPNSSASVSAIASATWIETWYASPAGSKSISAPITNVTAPGDGERAVRDDERLRDEERRREQHQQEPRGRDGQHLEAVEADDERDRADRAGQDQPRVPELDDDADQPDREHQRDDVRVDQQVEDPLPGRHLDPLDRRAGRRVEIVRPFGFGLEPSICRKSAG